MILRYDWDLILFSGTFGQLKETENFFCGTFNNPIEHCGCIKTGGQSF